MPSEILAQHAHSGLSLHGGGGGGGTCAILQEIMCRGSLIFG